MTVRRPNRRGLVIIPALVCLVLVTLLCGVLLRQASLGRMAAHGEERRMQAEWLAESGLARASARLAADRGYRGETWGIPPDALGGRAGVVRIAVEPLEDTKTVRRRARVRAEADYPRGDDRRARLSKTLIIDLGTEPPGGPS
jgi:hypothetical protein